MAKSNLRKIVVDDNIYWMRFESEILMKQVINMIYLLAILFILAIFAYIIFVFLSSIGAILVNSSTQ
ncbi:hypothetical protein HC928_08600 [bacterium]|nr:hypothetical protein [bacterium]